ncbi:MAG: sugar transferase [Thalassovita sp.]|nr:sugar transferase [Thalassovita sp.]
MRMTKNSVPASILPLSAGARRRNAAQIMRTASRGARGKRIVDLCLILMILPTIIPVIAVLYVLTRLDGGPGFFGHVRVGKDNRDFRCWKIRTMVPDAEKMLEEHLAHNPDAAAEWERAFKLKNDPRVTRLGRFLRETSLDELPQVWNVLRGDMSLVGPRPVTREELRKYQGYDWYYLSVRPGITGLWQVSGRNDLTYAERVRMDMDYVNTRSLLKDMHIILRTACVVMYRTGR